MTSYFLWLHADEYAPPFRGDSNVPARRFHLHNHASSGDDQRVTCPYRMRVFENEREDSLTPISDPVPF